MISTDTKEKKHIAMYIGSLNKGGAERVMGNLAEFFYSRGYEVTLVTTYLADEEYELPHGNWSRTAHEDGDVECSVLNLEEEPRKVWLSHKEGIKRVFTALPLENRAGRIANLRNRVRILRYTWKE